MKSGDDRPGDAGGPSQSELRFKALFDQAPVGIALIDSLTGHIYEVNPMFAKIAGRTMEEVPRTDWMSITHPDDVRKDLDQMALLNAGKIPGFRMEKRYIHPDGSVVWINMTIAPLTVEDKTKPRHFCMIEDITERKRVEEALRESHLLVEGIINAMPIRIFWKNKDLIYMGCNATFAREAGFPDPKDIVGKDDFQMGWRAQAELYRGDDRQVIESGRAKLFIEEPQTTPEGNPLVLLTSKLPLRNSQGEIIGVLGTYIDITERKKDEAALANMQKLESLGTLAGGIAHDFNNILTAILGNLSLLQSQMKAGGEALELVQEAQEACETAKGLSNQLLTFAKGGSPVVSALDLRSLLTQAAVFAARGSNAHCVLDLGASPLAVNVDKDQVAQVIHNLVINAIQATPEGGDIKVRAAAVALGEKESPPLAAGRYVRVTVSDQGVGIPQKHLSTIFDPYFSTKAVGRGLGLSVCYSIMAKHGGNIAADSRPGEGSVFTLHFPAADAADIPPEQEHPALTAGSGRILIMDDEAPLAKVLTRLLERLGYQADSVGDGLAALDAYKKAMAEGRPYDAVIMDLTIPGGLGGKETIGKLAALDPKAKAIVSSGYANNPIMSDYAAHGFSGVLIKPYRLEHVSEALRRVVGSTRS